MQDTVWKKIIEALFQDFVSFFLPNVFLDKEFEKLFPETRKGKRYVDKLVKVFLNSLILAGRNLIYECCKCVPTITTLHERG